MKNYKLLDCTLRDGGFVNEWNFGHNCINNIAERLERGNVDIIELGYLRDFVAYDKNSTQFPGTKAINLTMNKDSYKQMMVALMDYGCCAMENIEEKSQSILDGIRLTFKRKDTDVALDFARGIQKKGYKLFLQPVAITDYDAKAVVELIEKMNELDPYAVCMVDTYGFMNRHDLRKYFYLFDSCLKPGICLGYHSHNNYQLSYANAVELIEQPSQREIIIDSSVFGMGKGAGNLNTELMVSYFNENAGGNYDVNHILEIIGMYLEKERKKNFWGYNLKYYLAAINDCHHQYVQYLLEKKTLTIESVNKILTSIDDTQKTMYDEDYIKQLYQEYQNVAINDEAAVADLARNLSGEILILAPGYSLIKEKDTIRRFIEEQKPTVISVNHYIKEYEQDYIFVSNSIRYSQLENEIEDIAPKDIKIIATSNISPTVLTPDYTVNYKSLLLDETNVRDNAALMFIRLLLNMGYKKIAIAGFDGFDLNTHNYYDTGISLDDDLLTKNKEIGAAVCNIKKQAEIDFITETLYNKQY